MPRCIDCEHCRLSEDGRHEVNCNGVIVVASKELILKYSACDDYELKQSLYDAAPELLEFSKELINHLGSSDFNHSTYLELKGKLESLIAKAEGRETNE